MTYPTTARRTLVLKARWDSILLAAAAVAVTLGLAATIHSRASDRFSVSEAAWTGDLTDVTREQTPPALPLTSASLVVPRSELALPKVSVRALTKIRGCNGSVCNVHGATPPDPRPSFSQTVAAIDRPVSSSTNRPSLMSRFNPLNHLPDVSKISRPIDVASDAFKGWFRRL